MYACLYQPPAGKTQEVNFSVGSVLNAAVSPLVDLARDFSPRCERHRDELVSIDISGLARLFGTARAIGEQLRRDATARGLRVHDAIAAPRMAAMVLVHARPGLTVVDPGGEADALAPIPIGILEKIYDDGSVGADRRVRPPSSQRDDDQKDSACSAVSAFKRWGIKTLGELAALPPADLAARLGTHGLACQAIARGADLRPLVPTLDEERFESSLDLEWPIEGLEPLSFVLTRLLEPLSIRLERRDRGAAVLHVRLRLVGTGVGTCSGGDASPAIHERRLQLPSPIRDVRTLRTLALLDLESHPPAAAIDRVAVIIEPTPGRVLQHTLFTRAHPTPEQLSTLVARLGALMGQDRIGAAAAVDSYRPGAFEMKPFDAGQTYPTHPANPTLASALRRCRDPVPARVSVADDRPVRLTTDRRGFTGGAVVQAAGPWRTSGHWWSHATDQSHPTDPTDPTFWSRDEWDVAVSDGVVYRIFRDRETDRWFIDAIVD